MVNLKKDIIKYISNEIESLGSANVDSIANVIMALHDAYNNSAHIYVFGNGGSAATATHMQTDFNKNVSEKLDKKFNFICLNNCISTISAIANDFGYKHIFSFQLEGRLKKGDLVIGISGSGNSENILEAIQYAKTQDVTTIGICGNNSGELSKVVDICLCANSTNMQIIEDIHMTFIHLMVSIFMACSRE